MRSGIHLPNRPTRVEDFTRVSKGGFTAAKLMLTEGTQHTTADLLQLQLLGVKTFVLRLPATRLDDGRFYGAQEYVDKCISVADPLVKVGAQWVEFDTEPNWRWYEDDFGPKQYQAFMRDVMERIKDWVEDRRLRTISPALSFSSALWHPRSDTNPDNPGKWTLDNWHAQYDFFDHDHAQEPLWALFDAVGATVYWGSEKQRLDSSYGALYATVHGWSGHRPVVVVEYGNTTGRQATMAYQYPLWLRAARDSKQVSAAYMFLLDSAGADWQKYVPGDAVLAAVKGAI